MAELDPQGVGELPIACSLTAADQAQRLNQWRRLLAASAPVRTLTERGASALLDLGCEPALRELIAAEAECCAFLEFDLERDRSALKLTVEGPPAARPVILDLLGLDGGQS